MGKWFLLFIELAGKLRQSQRGKWPGWEGKLYEGPRIVNSQIRRQNVEWWLTGAGRREEWVGVSTEEDEQVLEMVGGGCTVVWRWSCLGPPILKSWHPLGVPPNLFLLSFSLLHWLQIQQNIYFYSLCVYCLLHNAGMLAIWVEACLCFLFFCFLLYPQCWINGASVFIEWINEGPWLDTDF